MLTASPDDRAAPIRGRRLPLALWLVCAQLVVAASCTESVPVELPPLSHSSSTASTTEASPDDEHGETTVAFIIERPIFPIQTHDGVLYGTAVPASRRLAAERLQADAALARRDAGIKGFVNRYSTTSPPEDKAELYALMVVDPEEAHRRLADDDVLHRKATKIREMIDAFGPYSTLLTGR